MPDIINLLPDSVANQIAAGEVIQRPASVVKELVENAIDARATEIKIIIKDAGRTSIQIIDNGIGMSETDARMAFERHATSKISKADDLFNIRTMGFRGEALASVSAIAQVELKTCSRESDLGTLIEIHGSKLIKQEPVSSTPGTVFTIKNLFYNVPARRKFLKSNQTEFRHILTEFNRIVLANPEIQFSLIHNNQDIYQLPASNDKQRISNIFGKNINKNLVSLSTETSIIKISGFIGKPETAKKSNNEQYFFVNGRFMKHYVFHKAVMNAYFGLIPSDTTPSYFIFFEVLPENIDVNIHPTKTEIKFESEQAIFQILEATVKEGIGKANLVPAIDFETQGVIDIPTLSRETEIKMPEIKVNPNFNPFDNDADVPGRSYSSGSRNKIDENWQQLYAGFERNELPQQEVESKGQDNLVSASKNFLQIKRKYIATNVKSGLMLIDQKRAHERILFERFIHALSLSEGVAQASLFPQKIELSEEDYQLVLSLLDNFQKLGFDLADFGNKTIVVNACPAEIENADPQQLLAELITEYKANQELLKSDYKLNLAKSLASASAVKHGTELQQSEMDELFNALFACSDHSFAPDGKAIINIITEEDILNRLK